MSDRHRAHSGRYALIRQYVKMTPRGRRHRAGSRAGTVTVAAPRAAALGV